MNNRLRRYLNNPEQLGFTYSISGNSKDRRRILRIIKRAGFTVEQYPRWKGTYLF